MAALLLGIDAGTTVIKSTLFDLDGHELASAARPSSLLTPQPGWAEADMDVVWLAVAESVREVVARAPSDAGTIAAIGVTAQGDGAWLVDDAGCAVRPALLWCDGRMGAFVQQSRRSGLSAEVFAITGTALTTGHQSLHLRWFQEHEPATLARTAAVLRAKDWIFLKLTGVVRSDNTDASGTWFDVTQQQPDERIGQLLGVQAWAGKLPATVPPAENSAPLAPEAARLVGLPAGLPVVAGPYDVAASALGAGAVAVGDACSVLGTAGVHQVVIDRPVWEPPDIGYHIGYVPPGRLLRLLPAMACTPNLEWYARNFYTAERAAAASPEQFWDGLEARAAQVAVGAGGVLFHPYIDPAGERAPFVCPDAGGQFTGLSLRHGRDVLLRAVYEGVVLSVLDCYQTMSVPVTSLRLAGGGARSRLWPQLLADALGCPVTVAEGSEYGAKGAVINAGVAVGLYATHAEGVARTVRVARRYAPTPGAGATYAALLRRYRATREAMVPVWEQRSLAGMDQA